MTKKSIIERLNEGPVLGDGGFVFSLEKRGYVMAGQWTPEAVVENPEAVTQLHEEFRRAGSDVAQAFTFYASQDKLENRGNTAGSKYGCERINRDACKLARKVMGEDGLVLGGICQTPTYLSRGSNEEVKNMFREQVKVFKEENVDFLLCEYYEHIEEMCLAIDVCKETKLPVAASMCIGPEGDLHGNSAGECAVAMAKQGADIVGVNCHFDPFVSLEAMKLMKKALVDAGFNPDEGKPHLMVQPLAYMTPDATKQGFIDLPEFPFALESRVCTRAEMREFGRQAWDIGIRFIGGCCGFEPYHIRAVAEELLEERGKRVPESSQKGSTVMGEQLLYHTKPWVRNRANPAYWQNLKPASGRPLSSSLSKPDNWGVTQGDESLQQQKDLTTQEQVSDVRQKVCKSTKCPC